MVRHVSHSLVPCPVCVAVRQDNSLNHISWFPRGHNPERLLVHTDLKVYGLLIGFVTFPVGIASWLCCLYSKGVFATFSTQLYTATKQSFSCRTPLTLLGGNQCDQHSDLSYMLAAQQKKWQYQTVSILFRSEANTIPVSSMYDFINSGLFQWVTLFFSSLADILLPLDK